MKTRFLVVLSLLVTSAALAQGVDPLHNVSGTAGSPGTESPWVRAGWGGWTFFHGLDAHATYVSESGPEEQRDEAFSTNWLAAGLHRDFGGRGFVLLRGRASFEPYTVPEEGYPQMLQYVPDGTPFAMVDSMRAHDLLGEAAVQVGWRPTPSTLLHVYGGFVGDPALGPPPSHLRASGVDFAEAPFGYEVHESFNDSTSVVTAGFATPLITLEASVFHDAFTTGRHTDIDTGDIDSRSARITLTPGKNLAIQYSQGELGEDADERDITSASVSYGTNALALTALWTKREESFGDPITAKGVELALRGARNTVMGRAEWVDRPAGFPILLENPTGEVEHTTHFAVGYIFDFLASAHYRAGAGVNIDYHSQSHDLPSGYGHKPQAIYAFLRFRSR